MRHHVRTLISAMALGILASAMALPTAAQNAPKNLIEQIKSGVSQDVVLARCAGYFKAMMMANQDADPALIKTAEETISWLFENVVAMRGEGMAPTENGTAELSLAIAEEIDDVGKFYLETMLDNIAETGKHESELITVDQNTCLIIASKRPKDE